MKHHPDCPALKPAPSPKGYAGQGGLGGSLFGIPPNTLYANMYTSQFTRRCTCVKCAACDGNGYNPIVFVNENGEEIGRDGRTVCVICGGHGREE